MAYQATSATSVPDFIDKLATFAGANGWTVHRNDLAGALRTLTVSKGGDYVHVWNTTSSDILIRASVGYDGGLAPSSQPNQSVSSGAANTGTGPFSNVFFFENASCLFAVIEISSGIFRHLCFGMLTKYGAYTGGTFFDAVYLHPSNNPESPSSAPYHHPLFSNWSQNQGNSGGVRCDVDGNSNYFAPFRYQAAYATPVASGAMQSYASGDQGGRTFDAFYNRSINSWSGVTPLQPIKIRVERPGGAYYSEIGHVPGIRFLNMTRFQVGDEFSVGPDTWKVFPWIRKGYVVDQPYSSELGWAYLKT
jgi:hypothetical protein